MATVYDLGITNHTGIPAKIIELQLRINNSLEIDITLNSITDNSSLGYLSFTFASALSPLQYITLVKLVSIIVEVSTTHREYTKIRIIETTRVPNNYNDDLGGYSVGCVASNKSLSIGYICVNDTTANAIWEQITLPPGTDPEMLQYDAISNSRITAPGKYASVLATGYIIPTTNFPVLSQPAGLGGALLRYVFQNPTISNEQYLSFELVLPNSYKEGTDIIPFLEYFPMDPIVAGEEVAWTFTYVWTNIGDNLPGVDNSVTQVVSLSVSQQNQHLYLSFGNIFGGGKQILSVLSCNLTRSVPPGTAYSGQCALLKIGLHHINDGIGSSGTTTK